MQYVSAADLLVWDKDRHLKSFVASWSMALPGEETAEATVFVVEGFY